MKIIITESQLYNLIPNEIKRRITNDDLIIIDRILRNNLSYFSFSYPFNEYIEMIIRDTLNEFVNEYKLNDINYDLDDWGDKESDVFNLWWGIIPFLEKRYHNELLGYYMKHMDN